jgi:hypothetical protein
MRAVVMARISWMMSKKGGAMWVSTYWLGCWRRGSLGCGWGECVLAATVVWVVWVVDRHRQSTVGPGAAPHSA